MWLRREEGEGEGNGGKYSWTEEEKREKREKRGKRGKVRGREREKKVKNSTTYLESCSMYVAGWDLNRMSEKRKNNSSTAACFSETTDCFHYCIFHFRPHTTTNEHIFLHTVDIVVAMYTTTSALVVYKATATVCTPNAPLGLRCHAAALFVFPSI